MQGRSLEDAARCFKTSQERWAQGPVSGHRSHASESSWTGQPRVGWGGGWGAVGNSKAGPHPLSEDEQARPASLCTSESSSPAVEGHWKRRDLWWQIWGAVCKMLHVRKSCSVLLHLAFSYGTKSTTIFECHLFKHLERNSCKFMR